jgi:DNA repair protein RecO (recombination protein O)
MLKRTEGIILKTIPFGEADLIVTYLTPDFGLLKLFAKSPRKIRSRFGSSLEPLTHANISFWGKEDANLPKLTQSDIIHTFHKIRDSLQCFLKVSEIVEVTLHFVPERDVNKKVYSLILQTLQTFEKNLSLASVCKNTAATSIKKRVGGGSFHDDLLATHYKVKFLKYLGYSPKLDSCGRCGNNGYCFYLSSGSIMCESCSKDVDSPLRLSPPVIRFYTDLLTWEPKKIQRLKPSEEILSELSAIINMHIKYILSKPLRYEAFKQSMSLQL